ncbi:MAG: class I SAM-dependent methyltransferase [Acidimicrobiia bacterium]
MEVDRVRDLYDSKAGTWRWTSVPDTILGLNRLRSKLYRVATGNVLDVGCGTGENFKHLSGSAAVTAVDISSQMLSEAHKRARKLGMKIDLIEADAANLPFEDNRFDVVVSAFSSCTFPDHVGAFSEMERVARPGGRVVLLEHGRSSVKWLAARQDRSVARHFDTTACRSNRDPIAEIDQAGLEITSHRRSHLGMIHRVEIEAT